MKKDRILTDPLHWSGWILSSLAILLTFYLFIKLLVGTSSLVFPSTMSTIILFVIIFIVEAGVDVLKHHIKLQ